MIRKDKWIYSSLRKLTITTGRPVRNNRNENDIPNQVILNLQEPLLRTRQISLCKKEEVLIRKN